MNRRATLAIVVVGSARVVITQRTLFFSKISIEINAHERHERYERHERRERERLDTTRAAPFVDPRFGVSRDARPFRRRTRSARVRVRVPYMCVLYAHTYDHTVTHNGPRDSSAEAAFFWL